MMFDHATTRRALRLALLLGAGLFLSPAAAAQSGPTGSLTGVVHDPNGAAVPAAAVTVKNPATGLARSATADADGRWAVPALPVGAYEVLIEAQGFKRTQFRNVPVEAAVPRTLDAALEVGEIAGEVVNVTGEGAALATPDTSAVARQLSAEQLVAIPTSTRSFTQLLSAEAGVNTELSPVLTNGNGNQSPSVNGTRTTSTSLFFNGVDATNVTTNEGSLNDNIAPAPETLQEVKLQTSLYDASTGRSGGGNFQLVTKAGTNDFSGSAYYYVQNERFNANDFFFNKEGIAKPKARRNETGFTLGGPVVGDRWFFFGGYQATSAVSGFVPTARGTTVLPLALRRVTGDRTAEALAAAFNAENGCAGSNCLLPSDISPVAVALFNLRNPVTGDYVIPAPRAGGRRIGVDRAGARAFVVGAGAGSSRTASA